MTPVTGPSHPARRLPSVWPRFPFARSRFACLALLLAASLGFVAPAKPQQGKPQEYTVKAVYLYNFGRFVEWPADSLKSPSFSICILGQDPFGPTLDSTLAGESINDRKLFAKRIASPRDALACQILFISDSETARLKEILLAVQKSPVLTVSDVPNFAATGGMIQFVVTENKVRFSVNLSAAEKAGLTLSSQLLKVAMDVRKDPSNGAVPQ